MKKTLVVVAHPTMEQSIINKRWLEALKASPEQFTIHELYQHYANQPIEAEKEQQLVDSHTHLVLQFPVYWFNSPPLLKQWLDEVFTYGWAYGAQGKHLAEKKVGLAVSAGIRQTDYHPNGRYQYTLAEVLRPFEVTMQYVHADYQGLFAFYGEEKEPGTDYASSQEYIEQSAHDYRAYLDAF